MDGESPSLSKIYHPFARNDIRDAKDFHTESQGGGPPTKG